MTRKLLIIWAAFGSFALLAGAYLFQFIGYTPCQMCLWQRWPHFVAIAVGLVAMRIGGKLLPALGALATATTSAIGVYHTGVERDWWEGPSSCTGTGGDLSGDLLSLDGPRLVMCDQVSWELFSLSMASWNALFAAGLCLVWIAAFRKS